jgi:tRNA 2-selenouridine synthase
MSLKTLPATDALDSLSQFDTIIDARTPAEHAEDRLPGAVNWPSLDDEQRVVVGTLYKQVNAFEAKKRGAAMVARNVAAHIERELLDKPKGWKPLVYCWRGGNRSGAMATIFSAIGFQVTLLEGGYKAFRQAVLADIPLLAQNLNFRVVCGPTGVGKTRLLHALARAGAQVLDLEALAEHRSSVLGSLPGQPQPSQRLFDSRVWAALRAFDRRHPVYVEAESKRVGNVTVNDALMTRMRASSCLTVALSPDARVKLLMEDYAQFSSDTEFFCERLGLLTVLRGKNTVATWQAQARAGDTQGVVQALLDQHYDPKYEESMRRNFAAYAQSRVWTPADGEASTLQVLAQDILAEDSSAGEAAAPISS